MTHIDALNRQFSVPGLRFDQGPGGMGRACVETSSCAATLFLQGAHLTEWTPAGHQPILWMSRESFFVPGKPIRGGIPICFPWFGPHPSEPTQPAHGTARITEWSVVRTTATPGGDVALELQTDLAEFSLVYRIDLGRTLKLQMTITCSPNATSAHSCEIALHTYLTVGDIQSTRITGLEHTPYIDKMDNAAVKQPTGEPVTFSGETDRVYFNTEDRCTLIDPVMQRRILVEKCGSKSTVVWNPWIAKSQRMPDFGDHEWPGMVCIESANVGPDRLRLSPGESSAIAVQISVE